jgi:hypothetical protein
MSSLDESQTSLLNPLENNSRLEHIVMLVDNQQNQIEQIDEQPNEPEEPFQEILINDLPEPQPQPTNLNSNLRRAPLICSVRLSEYV